MIPPRGPRPRSGHGAREAPRALPGAGACLFAGLLACLLALALGGCARGRSKATAAAGTGGTGGIAGTAEARAYPYSAREPRAFLATDRGLVEAGGAGEGAARAVGQPLPMPRAPNASVLTASGGAILAALNGWGLARVEVAPDASAYRVLQTPLPSLFAGLSTGGAWPLRGGFLVQLYRDPFGDGGEAAAGGGASAAGGSAAEGPARAPSSRLVFLDREGLVAAPEPFGGSAGGGELFALFPALGLWYAELRVEGPERARMSFWSLEDPLASGASGPAAPRAPKPPREIGRSSFEAALKPKGIGTLPAEVALGLVAALEALGPGPAPRLLRLRSAGGDDGWYLEGGRAEDAAPAYAWYQRGFDPGSPSPPPARVLVLDPEGDLAIAGGRAALIRARLEAPEPGAAFTALAAVGDIVAAAWEAGEFPEIGAAGIVIASPSPSSP